MPWVFIPVGELADQMRTPKAMFFDVICLAIISCSIIFGQKVQYKNKYLGWLFIYLCFSFWFNWFFPYMWTMDHKRVVNVWNVEAFIHFILSIFASICIMSSIDRLGYIRIAKAICLSAFFVSAFGIIQAIGFDPMSSITTYHWYEKNHIAALLDHPNTLGNFLALSIPFFLFFEQPVYWIGLLSCLVCLFLTHSTTSIVALVFSMAFFFSIKYINRIKYLLLIGVVFTSSVILFLTTPSFNKFSGGMSGRAEVWSRAIEQIRTNPLFGNGLNSFYNLKIYTGTGDAKMRWAFAHNDYIQMGVEIGFIGLALFLVLIFNTFRNFNLSKENKIGFSYISSLVAFLVVMMGNFPMEFAPTALIGLLSFCGSEKC